MSIRVRRAGRGDYEALQRLFEIVDARHRAALPHVFRDAEGPARSREYMDELVAGPESVITVAEQGGRLVGLINVQTREAPDLPILVPRRYAVVDALVVEEGARRQGVGRALMEAGEDWARKQGASSLELTVWEFNTTAIAFYESMGYNTARRRMWKALG
jgi:GNAT superfamily N-acetyltransferase